MLKNYCINFDNAFNTKLTLRIRCKFFSYKPCQCNISIKNMFVVHCLKDIFKFKLMPEFELKIQKPKAKRKSINKLAAILPRNF